MGLPELMSISKTLEAVAAVRVAAQEATNHKAPGAAFMVAGADITVIAAAYILRAMVVAVLYVSSGVLTAHFHRLTLGIYNDLPSSHDHQKCVYSHWA